MLRNYIIIAWRNLLKNKGYAFINIIGLASGMAVAMLIGLWIHNELSFNHSYKNYSRIAQVMRHTPWQGEIYTGGQSSPMPLASELRSSFGNDFERVVMSTHTVNYIFSNGDKKISQSGRFMEAEAGSMLSLNMLYGNHRKLGDLNSILLSASVAKKLFSDTYPINKTLTIDTKTEVKVAGIYEDFSNNSEFYQVGFIAPFELFVSLNTWAQKIKDNWRDNSFPIYVQIASSATFERLSAKIKDVMLPHIELEKRSDAPSAFFTRCTIGICILNLKMGYR